MSLLSHRTPRRVVTRTLGFGIGALVAAGALVWTPAAASAWNQSSAEATLWQLLNGARANNGVGVLQQHSTLIGLARWRSSDMLAKNYFSHTIAGCGCLVYAYYDSNGLRYGWAGENIGWNSGMSDADSPVRIHEGFMNSAGHRANVLDPRFTHGGVGAAAADNQLFLGHVQNTRMYTELFMQASVSAPPPPPPAPAPPPSGGGGGGGSAGGGSQATVSQPVSTPEPKPKHVKTAAPQRPTSSAGIDGVATVVSRPPDADAMIARLRADEVAASRASALDVTTAPAPIAARDPGEMEVAAAPRPASGFEGIVGAILGFLFG